jgi:hypothetical protein
LSIKILVNSAALIVFLQGIYNAILVNLSITTNIKSNLIP